MGIPYDSRMAFGSSMSNPVLASEEMGVGVANNLRAGVLNGK